MIKFIFTDLNIKTRKMKRSIIHYFIFMITWFLSFTGSAQVEEHKNLYSESGVGSAYMNTTYYINTDVINELTNIVDTDVDFLDVYFEDGSSISLHDVGGYSLKQIFEGQSTEGTVVDITTLRDDYYEWFKLEDGTISLIHCNAVARTAVTPENVILVTEDMFSDNGTGTQYLNTVYFAKFPATMDDMDKHDFPDDMDWLSVYVKNDSLPYERIDITQDLSGKTFKTILEENGIAMNQLVHDYKEWFLDADGNRKLLRVNMKAMKQVGNSILQKYPDLYAEGEHDRYRITAYKINVSASIDHPDLNELIPADEVDFVNIYLKGLLPNKYRMISVAITADISIRDILATADNGSAVTPDKLKDNYREWFIKENPDGSFSPVLKNINFKAVKTIGTVEKVKKITGLFSSGSSEYENIAYKVNSNATLADLEPYTMTADFVNIYTLDDQGNEVRHSLHGVKGKTLRQVFEGQSTEGTVIAVSDLRQDFVAWFRDSDDKYKLVNLNVKENIILPDAEKIIITKDLYSKSGSSVFENTAYLVKNSASESDMDEVRIDDDVEYLNVYTTDESNGNNGRFSLHGIAGKTLKEALAGANDEGITIGMDILRDNYVEWFKNSGDEFVLINLNIKAVKQTTLSAGDDPELISTSVYPNPVSDYINVSIPNNMSFKYSVYSLTGKVLLKGKSDSNKTRINVSALRSGLYILKLKSGSSVYSTKFVK
jgi:hypothetical protein